MDDRTRLVRADETGETFRKNAAQIFLHMLDSRNSEISSSEESLEGEPSWMAGGLPIRTTAHTNPAEIAGRWSAPMLASYTHPTGKVFIWIALIVPDLR
jgi:hypothetical protein